MSSEQHLPSPVRPQRFLPAMRGVGEFWRARRSPPRTRMVPAIEAAEHRAPAEDPPLDRDRDHGGEMPFLVSVIERHGFARYAQIAAIRAAPAESDTGLVPRPVTQPPQRRPAEAPAPGPRRRVALTPEPEAITGGFGEGLAMPPLSRYRAQVATVRPESAGDATACPFDAARFAAWYASAGAESLRGTAPVDRALASFLARDAADPWQGGPRRSRLMTSLPELSTSGAASDAAATWLAASDLWPALDAALVPDWVVEALAGVGPDGAGTPFPLGAWLMATHRGSAAYRQAYDLAQDDGRVGFAFDAILHHATTPVRRLVLNPSLVDWFAAPLDGAAGAPSRMEVLVGLATGWLSPEGPPSPSRTAALRRAFRGRACPLFPVLAAFATLAEEDWRAGDTRVEVIGMARSGTGLGQNLWMSVAALLEDGIAPVVRDCDDALARVAEGEIVERAATAGAAAPLACRTPRRKAALVHLNADAAPQILCHPLIDRHPDLHAIGFLLWEFEAVPRAHHLALDLLDEIWSPTRFLTDVYAAQTATPVHTVGKAITLPRPAPVDRRRFGLDPADTVFLVSFDFHSSVERKNPLAAVRAFHRAFGPPARGRSGRDGGGGRAGRPRLVLKTTPPVAGHWGDPNGMWPAIAEAAEADDRLVIIDRRLPFAELLGLLVAADALVSPHRGEGFGYMPAYSLALGRPAIATDYGGSRDFLTSRTGFPIAWSPRAVRPGETILPMAGAFWADVDLDALAGAMLSVAEAPEDALSRAAAGRRLIETAYSRRALAARYRARLVAAGILDPAGEDGAPGHDAAWQRLP